MPARKRNPSAVNGTTGEPIAKRRSSRVLGQASEPAPAKEAPAAPSANVKKGRGAPAKHAKTATAEKSKKGPKGTKPKGLATNGVVKDDAAADDGELSDDDFDSIPVHNPEAARHKPGEVFWLMKAEPESRFENGIDVRFSIDDLRAKTAPEGWDGIRAYPARNNMRAMNAGDMAFFYHSNCKEPAIVGTMEIVKEFSEDKSARRKGMPYYDPSSSRDNRRWSLVHVEFRQKFAVPIKLKELREMGGPGGPLASMHMLKQSRLSVSRVSKEEWKALCDVADQKATDAGLKHEV